MISQPERMPAEPASADRGEDLMTSRLTRRSLITAAAAAGTAVAAGPGSAEQGEAARVKTYSSADFYDADGNFLEDKAREAYYDMFRRFGYPISETIEKEMWILDFGLRDFARVGMAGIFWLNRQDHNYFGHEIYLLPGQMIPEHCHLATDKGGPKMESWQPRRGMIYTFGEGEATPEFLDKIPPSQRDKVRSQRCLPLGIDEIGHLNRLTAFHFMVGGPQGALVTEYGTFHDMDGLRFSNPDATL
jgi:D-lyxose ketol-isomerase